MAEEISKPLCEARKVTMVSSGEGEVGAAKLSGEVLDIMTRLPDAVEKLTGVSISLVTHVHFLNTLCYSTSSLSPETYVSDTMEDSEVCFGISCVLQVTSRTG